MKLIKKMYWLFLCILGLFLIIKGIWSLYQPWGVISYKLFALFFFSVILIYFLYRAFGENLHIDRDKKIKLQSILLAMGSLVLALGGIFMMVIEKHIRPIGLAAVLLFGFSFFVLLFKNKE